MHGALGAQRLGGSIPANHPIALAGNPLVGKSALLRALTGPASHTGRRTGAPRGVYLFEDVRYQLIELPGTSSLSGRSPEEAAALDFLERGKAEGVVVVCDAVCLERSLILVSQTLALTGRVVVCVNRMDEARRLGLPVDLEGLERRLGVPVIGVSAAEGDGLEELRRAIAALPEQDLTPRNPAPAGHPVSLAELYAVQAVRSRRAERMRRRQRMDRLRVSRAVGIPLLLLAAAVWLAVTQPDFARLIRLMEQWLNFAGTDLTRLLVGE